MGTWVSATTTSAGGNVSLKISGGYADITRTGNTITGRLGLRFIFHDQWSANSVAAIYNNVQHVAQNRSGGSGGHATVGDTLYCTTTYDSDNGYNTSEDFPWTFSAEVTGDEAGELTISMRAGWNAWDIDINHSYSTYNKNYTYTFKVPYPEIPERDVSLYIEKQKVDGSYESAAFWKTIKVKYREGYTETWSGTGFYDVTFHEDSVTTNHDKTEKANRTLHYLDLKGYLDNSTKDNITGYGTCDLSFNDGTSAKTGITDYYAQHRYGTTYTFSNVKPTIGHTYKGVHSGSLTGTITAATTTTLAFVTNDVFANCNKNQPGDVYIKVGNTWKRATQVYYNKNGTWQAING